MNNSNKILITKKCIKLQGTFLGENANNHVLDPCNIKINVCFKTTINQSIENIIGLTQSDIYNNLTYKNNENKLFIQKYKSNPVTYSHNYPFSSYDTNYISEQSLLDNASLSFYQILFNVDIYSNNLNQIKNFFRGFDLSYIYSSSYNLPYYSPSQLYYNIFNIDTSNNYILYNNSFNNYMNPDNSPYDISINNTLIEEIVKINQVLKFSYQIKSITYDEPNNNGVMSVLDLGDKIDINCIINTTMIENTVKNIYLFDTSNNCLDNLKPYFNNRILPLTCISPPTHGREIYNQLYKIVKYISKKDFIGLDHIIFQKDLAGIVITIYININVLCDNKKCWPPAQYNKLQHISIMGSARSKKMQMAHNIKYASSYKGRCSTSSVYNPNASIILNIPINSYTTVGKSSKSKKRQIYGFF